MERRETMLVTQPSPSANVSQQHHFRVSLTNGWGMLMSTEGTPHHLELKSTILGRLPPSNILVDDSRVSAKHFEIYYDQETQRCSPHQVRSGSPSLAPFHGTTYWIRDLSTNGTFVNHRKVGKGRACRVETGDEISIVQLPDSEAGVAAQPGGGVKRRRDGDALSLPSSGNVATLLNSSTKQPTSSGASSTSDRRYFMSFNFHSFAVQDPHSPPMNPSMYPQATPPAMPSLTEDSQTTVAANTAMLHHGLNQRYGSLSHGAHCFEQDDQIDEDDSEPPRSWQWGRLIGRGAQSQVYQAIDTTTGEMMAVKVLKDLMAEQRQSDGSLVPSSIRDEHGEVVCSVHASAGFPNGDPLKTDDDWEIHNPTTANMVSSVSTCAGSGGGDSGVGHCRSPGIFLLEKSSSVIHRRGTANGGRGVEANQTWDMTPEQRGELRLLRKLSHRKIVQYRGIAVQDGMMCILLEYVAGGSLQSLINTFGYFGENVVKIYTMQILQGLEYLHHQHVVHGDIKPANILVSDKGHIKLTDFGTGKILKRNDVAQLRSAAASGGGGCGGTGSLFAEAEQENPLFRSPSLMSAAAEDTGGAGRSRELVGTPHWMSPEFCRTGEASFASDIWALGCVVLEMSTGELPWAEHPEWSNPVTAIFNIANTTCAPSLAKLQSAGECEASEEMLDFLAQTFILDPLRRPSATQLLMHPFITEKRCPRSRVGGGTVVLGQGSAAMPAPFQSPAPPVATPKFQDHIGFLRAGRQGTSNLDEERRVQKEVGHPDPPSGLTAFMRDL